MPTALIADDEPLLLNYLCDRLAQLWPELELVATARNGVEALSLVHQHKPDFAFLDIRMPGLSGLQVAESLHHTRAVFVTAFDEYAVAAFERAAADYLLKPVSDERLKKCIDRLRQQRQPDPALLAQCLAGLQPDKNQLQWFHVGLANQTRLVALDEVLFFQSSDKYTELVTTHERHVIRTPLKELIRQLDSRWYAQVHRSYIVSLKAVHFVEKDLFGRYHIHLKEHADVLPLSRSFAAQFKQM
jgi:DNA-binding LytR/AlgR family response regulator